MPSRPSTPLPPRHPRECPAGDGDVAEGLFTPLMLSDMSCVPQLKGGPALLASGSCSVTGLARRLGGGGGEGGLIRTASLTPAVPPGPHYRRLCAATQLD